MWRVTSRLRCLRAHVPPLCSLLSCYGHSGSLLLRWQCPILREPDPWGTAQRTPSVQTLHEKEKSFCCIKPLDFRVCYFSLVDLILTKSVMTVQPLEAHKKQASPDCTACPCNTVWNDYKPLPFANVVIIMHLSCKKNGKYNSLSVLGMGTIKQEPWRRPVLPITLNAPWHNIHRKTLEVSGALRASVSSFSTA